MENKSNKGSKVLLALIFVLVLCTLGVTVYSMTTQMQVQKQVTKILNENVDTDAEDDVVIMDQYTIRSTKHISDAYLNGTEDQLSDRDKETLDMAKDVLKKIIKDDMNDYEKEKAVYVWLTSEMKNDTGLLTVIPTTSDGVDNPYGVLKNHQAVCVGYATTFRLFMQMLNIECKVVHSSDLIHSWDLVKLDDEWYHVDCYSDADTKNFRNFNMNDSLAEQSHDWNHDYVPAATGVKYSYAAMNSKEIKNIYSIPKFVKSLIDQEKNVGFCTFKEAITEEDEAAAKLMIQNLTQTLSSLSGNDETYFNFEWTLTADQQYMLCLYIERYGDNDDIDVDDKTAEKINTAISDVFGMVETYDYDNSEDMETTAIAKG